MTRQRSTHASPLTQRQAETLAAIETHLLRYGCAPTFSELGVALRCARNAVFGHVEGLRRKGRVTYAPGQWRGLRLVAREGALVLVVPGPSAQPCIAVRRGSLDVTFGEAGVTLSRQGAGPCTLSWGDFEALVDAHTSED